MQLVKQSKQSGYTLVELLVVIAIMVILATVVLGALNNAREKALIAKTQAELHSIYNSMALLYEDTGWYPNAASSVCRTSPGNDNEIDLSTSEAGLSSNGSAWPGWNGPYMAKLIDTWGTPYFLDEDYECQGTEVGCQGTTDTISALVSCGPDLDASGPGVNGSCAYNADNVVYRLCQ